MKTFLKVILKDENTFAMSSWQTYQMALKPSCTVLEILEINGYILT